MLQTSGMKVAFIFPSAATSYAKIAKGECSSNTGKQRFHRIDVAEPHPILCKDVANERNESCFHIPECSYILCKESERRVQRQSGKPCFYSFGTAEPHPILCKCTKKNSQSNKIRLNFITLRHHPLRSPRTRASASAAVRSNGPLCSSFNVHMAAANRPASE